jgi:hypothetical protein
MLDGAAGGGLGQPALERQQAGLGAEAEEEEDEGGSGHAGPGVGRGDGREVVARLEAAHQREGDRHRHEADLAEAEHEEGGLWRPRMVVPDSDQDVGQDRHRLPCQQEGQGVAGHQQQGQRPQGQVEQAEEGSLARRPADRPGVLGAVDADRRFVCWPPSWIAWPCWPDYGPSARTGGPCRPMWARGASDALGGRGQRYGHHRPTDRGEVPALASGRPGLSCRPGPAACHLLSSAAGQASG